MRMFYTEAVLQDDGTLMLERLPFSKGEAVDIYIEAHERRDVDRTALRGSVLSYEQPFEPVAQEEWAANQ
jgi:hypothetical protein